MPESMPIEPIETPQNQRTAPKGTELPKNPEALPETTEIRPIESFEPMVAVNPKDPKDTITISPIEQYLDQPIIQDLIAKGEIENIEYYGRVDYWNAPEFYRYEVLGNPKETELEHLAYEQISKEFGINEPTIAVDPPLESIKSSNLWNNPQNLKTFVTIAPMELLKDIVLKATDLEIEEGNIIHQAILNKLENPAIDTLIETFGIGQKPKPLTPQQLETMELNKQQQRLLARKELPDQTYTTQNHTYCLKPINRKGQPPLLLGYVPTKNLPNRKEIELQYLGQYLETTGIKEHIDGDRVGITSKQGTKAKSTRIVEYLLNGTYRINHLQITIQALAL